MVVREAYENKAALYDDDSSMSPGLAVALGETLRDMSHELRNLRGKTAKGNPGYATQRGAASELGGALRDIARELRNKTAKAKSNLDAMELKGAILDLHGTVTGKSAPKGPRYVYRPPGPRHDYLIVDPEHIPLTTVKAAQLAINYAVKDLGIERLGVLWYATPTAHQRLTGGAKSIHAFQSDSAIAGQVRLNRPGSIWLNADRPPGATGFVAAHEVRHVWQLKHNKIGPTMTDAEVEAAEEDADNYAEQVILTLTSGVPN